MNLRFTLFLASRYLIPKRVFLLVITLLSLVCVILVVSATVVVISVMTGFSDKFRESLLGFEPHITITSDNGPMANWREVSALVRKQPGIVGVAPYVQGYVLVEHDNRVVTPMIRGIDPVEEQKVNDLKGFTKAGKFNLKGDNAVIGSIMAKPYSLNVNVGDKISVISPVNVQGIVDELQHEQDDPKAKPKTLKEFKDEVVLPSDLTVTGIFESGRYEYDSSVILVPLNIGQELYELGDSVHGLSVRTTDQNTADRVAEQLNTVLDTTEFRGVHAVAWMNGDDKNRIGAIKFEHNMMFVIFMFFVLVAGFCVLNTLITITVQKRREIGILKALGADVRQIVWVFLAQGMLLAIVGDIIGVACGVTMVMLRNDFKAFLERLFHIEIFPQDVYEFSQLPARIMPGEVALICLGAFVICSLASLVPAWIAARLDPVKALRYE